MEAVGGSGANTDSGPTEQVKNVLGRIKSGRRDLTQVKPKELQKLTELQAAHEWAASDALEGTQCWRYRLACDRADSGLLQVLQQQGPELDAHVQVVCNNANVLGGMSHSLLLRALEAGFFFFCLFT